MKKKSSYQRMKDTLKYYIEKNKENERRMEKLYSKINKLRGVEDNSFTNPFKHLTFINNADSSDISNIRIDNDNCI